MRDLETANTNINLKLSKSLLADLKAEAKRKELTCSALIRLILQAYFAK